MKKDKEVIDSLLSNKFHFYFEMIYKVNDHDRRITKRYYHLFRWRIHSILDISFKWYGQFSFISWTQWTTSSGGEKVQKIQKIEK